MSSSAAANNDDGESARGRSVSSPSGSETDQEEMIEVPKSKWTAVVKKTKVLAAQVRGMTNIMMNMEMPVCTNMTKSQIYAIGGGGDDVAGRLQNSATPPERGALRA